MYSEDITIIYRHEEEMLWLHSRVYLNRTVFHTASNCGRFMMHQGYRVYVKCWVMKLAWRGLCFSGKTLVIEKKADQIHISLLSAWGCWDKYTIYILIGMSSKHSLAPHWCLAKDNYPVWGVSLLKKKFWKNWVKCLFCKVCSYSLGCYHQGKQEHRWLHVSFSLDVQHHFIHEQN